MFDRLRRKPITAATAVVPAQIRTLGADRRFLKPTALPWQEQARWFARNVGLARFGAAIVSETISRMVPVPERRVGRDWVKGADQTVQDLIDQFVGYQWNQQQLLRLMGWHYQVSGEYYMADLTATSSQFAAFMTASVILNKDGSADVRLRPNADRKNGGLLTLDQSLLQRMWWADEDWPLLASSPMRAVIDDLQRYLALAGTVSRTATSALLEAGMLWTPEEAHVPLTEDQQAATGFYSQLEKDYYDVAQIALTNDIIRDGRPITESLGMYAPVMVHWADELKEPAHINMKRSQDPMNLDALEWCVKAYARGTNMPNQLVVEGSGHGNHWSAWLVDEKFHQTTTAPYADKMFHTDITEFFLKPTLRILKATGQWNGDPERWRVGYDPSPVLIHPDRSIQAIELYQLGLLNAEATLRENGLSTGDMPNDQELAKIIDTLTKLGAGPKQPGRPDEATQSTPGKSGGPQSGSTTRQDAPSLTDARFAMRSSAPQLEKVNGSS